MEKVMSLPEVLFLSNSTKECGVHQFGVNVAKALQSSTRYSFRSEPCDSLREYLRLMTKSKAVAVIYNYQPATMPWLNRAVTLPFRVPHIGIMHEVTQAKADRAGRFRFDFHLAPDPTLLLRNPIVFKTGRLIVPYHNRFPTPRVPTIGSFGFGFESKGFDRLIDRVQQEFDEAVVRLQITSSAFADKDGNFARAASEACRRRLRKPGIRLEMAHEFLSQDALLDFLGQNSLNAFFYDSFSSHPGRGISSVVDYALAVGRPVALTSSTMFRHVLSTQPSVCVEDSSLREILERGDAPLARYREDWCAANLAWDYERAVDGALSHSPRSLGSGVTSFARRAVRRALGRRNRTDWTPDTTVHDLAGRRRSASRPYETSAGDPPAYNRILDEEARARYGDTIAYMFEEMPKLMAEKIPAANVQQAFVLDTVFRLTKSRRDARVLCVGSFGDTAAIGLMLNGYAVEEVDPVVNYDLATFLTKPTCKKGSYDIVFSTSVIEHVADDESFVRGIASLLRPGGTAVLTCDFNDAYRPGDQTPAADFRFYTQQDLTNRLLLGIPDCSLVDSPRWSCSTPDFSFDGCKYTFASLVFTKRP